MAHNRATHRKQTLERGDCAQKEKIYPNGNVKPWSHRVPTRLHPICPQDFPHFLSSEQDASDRSLSEIIQVISQAQTIMLDAVVRFNPSFAWAALSGFSPPGYPFLPKSPLWGFRLAGCTVFSFLIPNFCPNPFLFFLGSPGCPFLPGLFYFCPAGQFFTKYLLTASAFTGDGKSSSSVVVSNKALSEKTLFDHERTFIIVYPLAPRSSWGGRILFNTTSLPCYPRGRTSRSTTRFIYWVQLPHDK
jgi:hypothetical protein